jgi:hypothetical protein
VDKIQSRSFADHRCARIVRKKHEYHAQSWQLSIACASGQLDMLQSARIPEYFAGKPIMRVARRFYTPDISLLDFSFDGDATK